MPLTSAQKMAALRKRRAAEGIVERTYWADSKAHNEMKKIQQSCLKKLKSRPAKKKLKSRLAKTSEDKGFWEGYMQGLLRNYYGEDFVADREHEVLMSISNNETDMDLRSIREGYRAGFSTKIKF